VSHTRILSVTRQPGGGATIHLEDGTTDFLSADEVRFLGPREGGTFARSADGVSVLVPGAWCAKGGRDDEEVLP